MGHYRPGDKVAFFRHGWITGVVLDGRTPDGRYRVQPPSFHGGGVAHVAEKDLRLTT